MANASALASLLGNGMYQQPNGLITNNPGNALGTVPTALATPNVAAPTLNAAPNNQPSVASLTGPSAVQVQATQSALADQSSPPFLPPTSAGGSANLNDVLTGPRPNFPKISGAFPTGLGTTSAMRNTGGSASFNEASPTGTPASGSAKSAGGVDSTPIVLTSANQNDPATISTWLQQHGISAADVPYWTQQIQGTGSPGLGDGTYWANKIANPGSSSSSGSGLPSLLSGLTTTLPDMSGNVAQTQGLSDPTLAGATSSDINAAGGQNAQLMQLLSLLQGQAK